MVKIGVLKITKSTIMMNKLELLWYLYIIIILIVFYL